METEEENKETESSITIICCAVYISRIKSIELVNQTFALEGEIILACAATKNDYNDYKSDVKGYKPKVDIINLISFKNGDVTTSMLDCRVVVLGDQDLYGSEIQLIQFPYTLQSVYKFEGEFSETFELENFPMDAQDLQINLGLNENTDLALFCPWFGAAPANYRDFGIQLGSIDISEYELGNAYYACYGEKFSQDFCRINYQIKILRKYTVYFWKIILVMFITTMCSFLSFTMDLESVGDIYGLLITLLLTATAFQFVVSTYIPNLSYLTLLDYYVISSFVVIFAVIMVIFVSDIINLDSQEYAIVGCVSFVVFVMVQSGFLIKFIVARNFERQKMSQNDLDGKLAQNKGDGSNETADSNPGYGPKYGLLSHDISQRYKEIALKNKIPTYDS